MLRRLEDNFENAATTMVLKLQHGAADEEAQDCTGRGD